jgi:hypothetical protein
LPLIDRKEIKAGNIFIGDSGASGHMVHSMDGIIDARDTNQKVTIGNGQSIHATKRGKLRAYNVSKFLIL